MPRKKKNLYFTKDHELAIIEYARSTDPYLKGQLYKDWIQPAFNEMVDKICFTYKFTSLPNVEYLRDDCKLWLVTILEKYDAEKGSKAFSYFSVITKNWFIHKVKKTTQQQRREIDYDNLSKNLEQSHLSTENGYDSNREEQEFWKYLWEEIDTWDPGKVNENEKKVLEAGKILLKSSDEIEIFNKKAVYLYLRELTGLNTKQVVNCLNKMRANYRRFKKDWNEGKY